MNYKSIIFSLMLTAPAIALANGDITGRAISKETNQPVDFATVQLIDAKTGKPLTVGTMTDENGYFTLSNVKPGNYLVRISSVGFVNNERKANVTTKNIDLGTLSLADDAKLLQEVVVEGVRSQMRFELDRKVFQVDANVVAAGQSASELLESIPSVEVDQDGEVSLRGDSSVTVWINGKESGLTADNRAQILEQIPGETIERIEVITNPSAKYSPEGTAGIINIVLKNDRRGGYFGSAELGANSRGGGNAGVSINYNSPKWEAYGSVGFRMRHSSGGSKVERTYSDPAISLTDDAPYQNQYADSRNHGNNLFIRAGVTYHPTSKDAIYFNGFGMFGHRWGHTSTDIYSNLRNTPFHEHSQYSSNRGDSRGAHAELGYTRKWSDNHTLDMMVSYNHWGGPTTKYYEESFSGLLPGMDPEIHPGLTEYETQEQKIHVNGIEAKVDYSKQLVDWLKLEAGYNGNYSHENTPVAGYSSLGNPEMLPSPNLFNTFIYQNNISALYLTLGGTVGKFSFSAGLRSESWQVRTRSLDYYDLFEPLPQGVSDRYSLVPEYKTNKFALFPSAFVSYSLPHDNEIQINYTRRIRRPWGGQLNSFVDISDPTEYHYGNPRLEPQYSNAFELNYIKSWTQHLISFSGYVRTSDNMINHLSYLYDGMIYQTHANCASEVNSGVELVAKNNLFRILDLTTTVNLFNNHISGWRAQIAPPEGFDLNTDLADWGWVSGEKRNSFAWNIRVIAGLKLPWGLSFQATGNYNSKMYSAQGTRQGGWSVDAGLRKNLGDWSISLNCRDLFDSRKFRSETFGDNYTEYSSRWRGGRTIRLTIKYAFGNMKAKGDRRQTSEPMDQSGYDNEME